MNDPRINIEGKRENKIEERKRGKGEEKGAKRKKLNLELSSECVLSRLQNRYPLKSPNRRDVCFNRRFFLQ